MGKFKWLTAFLNKWPPIWKLWCLNPNMKDGYLYLQHLNTAFKMLILHSFHRLAFRVAHNKQLIGGTCTVFVELTYKQVVLSRQHTAEHLKPVALLPLISCCYPVGYLVLSVEGRLTSYLWCYHKASLLSVRVRTRREDDTEMI